MSEPLLKRFAPFAELSDAECEDLAELLEPRALSPGETLFAEGDDADALVLVTEGSLELSSRRASGSWEAHAGSVVGGLSLLAVGARETAAAAGSRPVAVRLLRRAEFLRLAEDNPRAACRIACSIAAEVAGRARLALSDLGARSVDPERAGE